MNYQIITDSCCDFTDEQYRALEIAYVPLTVMWDGSAHTHFSNECALQDFYNGMRNGKVTASSALNPNDWKSATVILANAELLQNTECTEEDRADFISSILVMAQQMSGLVEKLLDLARLDALIAKTERAKIDLSDLLLDAVLPFEPIFFEKELALECDVQEDISIHASSTAITQLVDILLDNARKYSHPNTTVTVSLKRDIKNTCLLQVENIGEPIPQEDLKHIFKRFYRADKVRSMNQSYGLGLSIAEKIVSQHKGKIWATSENRKNTFYVQLKTI